MCNLYNVTTNAEAIIALTKAFNNLTGFNEPSRDIYPGYLAPVVRVGAGGAREIAPLTWGMPSPPKFLEGKKYDPGVTNIRNTASSHWRRWLGVESRCVVPVSRFAEPSPVKDAAGRTPNVWFARPDQSMMCFAGVWTRWTGVKKVRDGPRDFELFGFLTTEPNGVVGPVHQKAMPVLLTEPAQVDLWLTAPWDEAKLLQRPLPDDMLTIVDAPAKAA